MSAFKAIEYLKEHWQGSEPSITWVDHKLRLFLIDQGFSKNKDLVLRLKDGVLSKYWESSEINREIEKHVFIIDPIEEGYLRVSDYAKKVKLSRQRIHVTKDRYHWVIESPNIRYIKPC